MECISSTRVPHLSAGWCYSLFHTISPESYRKTVLHLRHCTSLYRVAATWLQHKAPASDLKQSKRRNVSWNCNIKVNKLPCLVWKVMLSFRPLTVICKVCLNIGFENWSNWYTEAPFANTNWFRFGHEYIIIFVMLSRSWHGWVITNYTFICVMPSTWYRLADIV